MGFGGIRFWHGKLATAILGELRVAEGWIEQTLHLVLCVLPFNDRTTILSAGIEARGVLEIPSNWVVFSSEVPRAVKWRIDNHLELIPCFDFLILLQFNNFHWSVPELTYCEVQVHKQSRLCIILLYEWVYCKCKKSSSVVHSVALLTWTHW